MPLDKVIVAHLDEMDKIEDQIDVELEKIISQISIDALMENPEQTLLTVGALVEEMVNEDLYFKVMENGIKFAKAIEDDGDIQIQNTDNPNENEALA